MLISILFLYDTTEGKYMYINVYKCLLYIMLLYWCMELSKAIIKLTQLLYIIHLMNTINCPVFNNNRSKLYNKL